jgi:hypothetical protein
VVILGEASRHARAVVITALVVGGLALLFAVISLVAALSAANSPNAPFSGGVLSSGKAALFLLGVARIGLMLVVLVFALSVLSRLPSTVRAPKGYWGAQQGYGPQQPYPGGPGGSGPYGYPAQGQQQPGWGQQAHGYGQPPDQAGWGQPIPDQAAQSPAPQPGWGQGAPQAWGPPPAEQPAWGQPPEQQGWGAPAEQQAWVQQPDQQGWGQPPGQQEWEQPPDQQGWGQPPAQQEWEQPPAQQEWEQQAGAPSATTPEPGPTEPTGDHERRE